MPPLGSHRNCAINIDDDDDFVEGEQITPFEHVLRTLSPGRDIGENAAFPIDLTGPDDQEIVDLENAFDEEESWINRQPPRANLPQPLPVPGRLLEHYKNVYIGTLVEVSSGPATEYHWQFLLVHAIFRKSPREVILRGVRLTRLRYLQGMFRRRRNELCALYDVLDTDRRYEDAQGLTDIPFRRVKRIRSLNQTNAEWPKHSYDRSQYKNRAGIEDEAILCYRVKFVRYYKSAQLLAKRKLGGGAILWLRAADIKDPTLRVTDDSKRNSFRGGIVRGGSIKSGEPIIPTVDIAGNDQEQMLLRNILEGQCYTGCDNFAGGGGVTAGMKKAGISVRMMCELDPQAYRTYQTNNPEVKAMVMDIFDMHKALKPGKYHHDLQHDSPPCQPYSPAHTVAGKHDAANIKSLYALRGNLNLFRPRIATGEQTFGLLWEKNLDFFHALVKQYTELGFSIRWDVLHLINFGVASIRKRLIWIASCPGEALPKLPAPTHSKERMDGLPRPLTLGDVLSNIPRTASLHNPGELERKVVGKQGWPKKGYSYEKRAGTITTSGLTSCHPSGLRPFTVRELATIQGFPLDYQFRGTATQIKKQIGNAFAPVVVEVLYRHIRKFLLQEDRMHERPPRGVHPREVIEISDGDGFHNEDADCQDDDGNIPPAELLPYRDDRGGSDRLGREVIDLTADNSNEDIDMDGSDYSSADSYASGSISQSSRTM
ncbi:S-adenosyl-L-methionine-dependent methyltransferase [Xylariaceae sp. FL0255]|nr:S-adenosyl-L-methionine-dependent methyltransferase [Xylariaceae sp. FL0255]